MWKNIFKEKLTDANCCQKPDALIRRVAEREERLGGVDGEGQGHNGLGAGPDDDALDPQSNEGQELAECHHDVGIVGAGLFDHASELGITVGADHGEDSADDPDGEGHVDGSGVLQNSGRRNEDSGSDDRSDDDGASVE